jgi:4-carboxymuconolactone decarboxylase
MIEADGRTTSNPSNRKWKDYNMSYDQNITLGGMFDIGLAARREVLGAAYVDKSMQSTNDFMMSFQHITTEWCWGYAWNRPGLDRKTRSMLNLAMLTALNRAPEIKLHTRGAITNGVTVDEIKEVSAARHGLLRHPGRPRCVQGRQ